MILLNKYKMSEWAYSQCRKGNDTQEMRDLITVSYYAYQYCLHIKDIEEMWRRIKNPYWAFFYCKYVKDREELRDLVRQYTDKIKFKYEANVWERS